MARSSCFVYAVANKVLWFAVFYITVKVSAELANIECARQITLNTLISDSFVPGRCSRWHVAKYSTR